MLQNKVYLHTAPYTITEQFNYLQKPDLEFVTVKYLFCGICGGDYSVYCGRRNSYPASLGHEFVAKIIAIGKNVKNFSIGDLVVSDFNYRCGKCKYCNTGKSHLCLENNIQKFSNRGFALYGNIHQNYLHKIPAFSFLPKACLIEPLSCVIHAAETLWPRINSSIVVNGCGSIGMLFIFYLTRVLNYTNVKIIETNEKRCENILTNFSVEAYNPSKTENIDIIIECSNSLEGLRNILELCPQGIDICIMSHLYGLDTAFVYEIICKKELNASFPLRNGEADNITLATSYIDDFWNSEDNYLIGIYDNVAEAFLHKASAACNKQIVQMSL